MYTKLERIAEIAKENPNEKFSALIHHINKEMLMQCHKELKGNKATGIDGKTKLQYEANLEENIISLLERMKKFSYKPQPVRRVYIPKPGSEKKRPLGISAYEDKLVQLAINKILTAIYGQDFLESSFGFRKGKGCHDVLRKLDAYLRRKNINYVVDAGIKRFLTAEIMENGNFQKSYEGTPQGGIISPTLANIYLHYALDLWFEKRIKKHCKGQAYLVRYACPLCVVLNMKMKQKPFIRH